MIYIMIYIMKNTTEDEEEVIVARMIAVAHQRREMQRGVRTIPSSVLSGEAKVLATRRHGRVDLLA